MFVKAVMTVLCTAGIAFYVRFLVALWNECEPRSTVIGSGSASALAKTR